jgi:hypothetical protein
MGHLRLGYLPKRLSWRRVVGLLDDDPANAPAIAGATVQAARGELTKLRSDPSLSYCFWLLTRITWYARQPNFVSELEEIGIDLVGSSSALSFVSAVSDHARTKTAVYPGSGVFREMANLALKYALSETIVSSTPSLFGSTIQNVQEGCRRYSSQKQFGVLARSFFSSFVVRFLKYFTDKELSNHIGPGRQLKSIDDGRSFNEALETYAWQSSRIIEDFASGWYSKHNWESEGDITEADARRFVAFALKKLQMELGTEAAL